MGCGLVVVYLALRRAFELILLAFGRRTPRGSRSWCHATSLRCYAARAHGSACSPVTARCLRRWAGCSHERV